MATEPADTEPDASGNKPADSGDAKPEDSGDAKPKARRAKTRSRKSAQGGALRAFAAAAAAHIEALEREADRVLTAIRFDAKAAGSAGPGEESALPPGQAESIDAIVETLAERSAAIKRDCQESRRILEQTATQLAAAEVDILGRTAAQLGAAEREAAEPSAGSARPGRTEAAPGAPSEGLRLLATQMAVAGTSREEIDGRLRDEFGVSDTDDLLDEIFSR